MEELHIIIHLGELPPVTRNYYVIVKDEFQNDDSDYLRKDTTTPVGL